MEDSRVRALRLRQSARPLQPGWPHLQSMSGVLAAVSHWTLQYVFPAGAAQLQFGCAHFFWSVEAMSLSPWNSQRIVPDYAFPAARAFLRFCANNLNIALLKAGISSGWRLLTQFLSTTVSLSVHSAPALRISSCSV